MRAVRLRGAHPRLSIAWAGHPPLHPIEFSYGMKNMSLLRHRVFIALGIFLWLQSRERLTRAARALAILAVVGAAMEIACRAAELADKLATPLPVAGLFSDAMLAWLLAAELIVLSVRAAAGSRGSPAGMSALRALGIVAYPFYLMHQSLGLPIIGGLDTAGFSPGAAILLTLGGVLAASLSVSAVLEPRLRR